MNARARKKCVSLLPSAAAGSAPRRPADSAALDHRIWPAIERGSEPVTVFSGRKMPSVRRLKGP
eukprot:11050216-Alexandrium_andersonii.AAC.1